jgi:hypothetical protein
VKEDVIVSEDDMLVLDDKIFNIYEKPIYFSSPTYPILEDIMGQRNEIMNIHDNHIFSSPIIFIIAKEDTLILENIINEIHENLSCLSSPSENIIEHKN